MIQITVTVENNFFYTSSLGFLCKECTNLLSLLDLCHLLKTERRSRNECSSRQVVNHLCINLLVTAENTQTRTLCSTVHTLANAELYLDSSLFFLCSHNRKLLKLLSCSGLTRLPADDLTLEQDTLALVRLWHTERTDFSTDETKQLLVT